MRVLVLGASGMIGSAIFKVLSEATNLSVHGTVRTDAIKKFFTPSLSAQLIADIDVDRFDSLVQLFGKIQPALVINCIGLTKHHDTCNDPLRAIPLNSLLPHRLGDLCHVSSSRLIHISTDCVFNGVKGNYTEQDGGDATDLYGKTKLIGEVTDCDHVLTLRTSTIGHELQSTYGLLEWFLAQNTTCKGFSKAVFSGLPNVVFAQVIRDYVIPNPKLSGLFHVGANPINKFELLGMIASTYKKNIEIVEDASFSMDRSFSSQKFFDATGYRAPDWPTLLQVMHDHQETQKTHV